MNVNGNLVANVLVANNGFVSSAESYNQLGIFERGRTVRIGEWQDVPFNAANFAAAGGTWTVSSAVQRFTIIGKTLYYKVIVTNSSVGGTPSELFVNLPSGYTSAGGITVLPIIYEEAGTGNLVGLVYTANDAIIHLRKQATGVWTASTNTTTVYVLFALEIA